VTAFGLRSGNRQRLHCQVNRCRDVKGQLPGGLANNEQARHGDSSAWCQSARHVSEFLISPATRPLTTLRSSTLRLLPPPASPADRRLPTPRPSSRSDSTACCETGARLSSVHTPLVWRIASQPMESQPTQRIHHVPDTKQYHATRSPSSFCACGLTPTALGSKSAESPQNFRAVSAAIDGLLPAPFVCASSWTMVPTTHQ
jgi:hypothetical protein